MATEIGAAAAARFAAARALPKTRGVRFNAELEGEKLEDFGALDEDGRILLVQASEKLRLFARACTRMLRVARTVDNLTWSEGVGRVHIAEVLSYRQFIGTR